MIRDNRRTAEYFTEYIAYQEKRIKDFMSLRGDLSGDKVAQCNQMISGFQKDLFVAKYSLGADKSELKAIFEEYIETLKDSGNLTYSECVDGIAIGILLDVDCGFLSEMYSDDLISVLSGSTKMTGEILFKDYYGPFVSYLTNELTEDEFIRFVEEEWYKNSSELYWYDTHKSDRDTYTGYWCWLAAACLRIKKSSIESDLVYIPKI